MSGRLDGTVSEFANLRFTGSLRDKFKLHLHGDVLRLVVEDQASPEKWSPLTRLTTWRLAADGADNYRPLGRLDLGPGENLYGTRFDGDRAYVVTFRRVDPLWIVDLSDPEHPRTLGELKIPGWSNYLQPLGDRLLAVGIDDTEGWRAAVQLFDVADPARPALLAKVPLGEGWSSSEAYWDEKAFGVFPDDGLVLIPFSSSGQAGALQGVQVIDLGRDTLKARGVVRHDSFTPRRSAVLGSRVLSLSERELLTADLADRDNPMITARLELARRTDRIVADRDHFLTFSGTELQVAAANAPDTVLGTFELGKLPVLGTARRADLLYVLQGVPAQIAWDADETGSNWTTSTNAGVVQLRILSLAALPKLAEMSGVATEKHLTTTLGESLPLWPAPGTLVWGFPRAVRFLWSLDRPAHRRRRPGCRLRLGPIAVVAGTVVGQPRTLISFNVSDPALPALALQSTFVERLRRRRFEHRVALATAWCSSARPFRNPPSSAPTR